MLIVRPHKLYTQRPLLNNRAQCAATAMKLNQILSIALCTLLTQSLASAQMATFDDFDNGMNNGGWSYNPNDNIKPTGGNPGGWLHQPQADTFAPIFTANNPNMLGDWRAGGVDKVSFDAILNNMNFGNGNGYEMSIMLRDTKGTPSVNDDDYAYYVGPNIPLLGAGWKSFDFAIPSQDTSAVPTGWKGGWVGDGENFRPGVTWNDVITNVTEVQIWWLNPAFVALFQQWNIGLDNIEVRGNGLATVRNGAGGNPLGYVSTSTPDTGSSWTSTIDIATPGHLVSVLAVSAVGPLQGVFPGNGFVGELLIDPTLLFYDIQVGAHSLPVPLSPSLYGLEIATQGATVDGNGFIYLNNAIDLIIGG
jgi:hypothetical protein